MPKGAKRISVTRGAAIASARAVRKKPAGSDPPKLPTGQVVARHIVVDKRLAELTRQMGTHFMDFLDLADEVVRERYFVRLHYASAQEYFSQRIGYSYRSLKRRFGILDGLKRIEEADGVKDRAACREALGMVGVHKAGILAPVLGVTRQAWRDWIKKAKQLSEEDLQVAVNKATGRARKAADEEDGPQDSEDAAWLKATLARVPADAYDETSDFFEAARLVLDTKSNLYVLAWLVQSNKVEITAQAFAKGWDGGREAAAEKARVQAMSAELAAGEAQGR